MSLVYSPPPKTRVGSGNNKHQVYTIHQRAGDAFCLQLRRPTSDVLKTTLVAFDRTTDATLFACMLENHRAHTKSWPKTNFDDLNTMFMLSNDLTLPAYPMDLRIQQWNFYDLNMYCMTNLLDLLRLKSVEKTNNSTYNVQGELMRIDTDISYQVRVYNDLYYDR